MEEQIICSNPEIEYPINFLAARTKTHKSLFEKIIQYFFLPRIYVTDTDDSQNGKRKEEIFLTLIRVGFLGFVLRWGWVKLTHPVCLELCQKLEIWYVDTHTYVYYFTYTLILQTICSDCNFHMAPKLLYIRKTTVTFQFVDMTSLSIFFAVADFLLSS